MKSAIRGRSGAADDAKRWPGMAGDGLGGVLRFQLFLDLFRKLIKPVE